MKFLKMAQGLVLTPSINRSLSELDAYFENVEATVTSGLRTQKDQMRIILEKCKRHGINNTLYPEFVPVEGKPLDQTVEVDKMVIFWWARAWSKLLNLGDVVNPPLEAEALFDYFRPGSEINRKGRIIGLSPHQKGHSFDLCGKTLDSIAETVEKAKKAANCFILAFLKEPINNAVHVDVEPITSEVKTGF